MCQNWALSRRFTPDVKRNGSSYFSWCHAALRLDEWFTALIAAAGWTCQTVFNFLYYRESLSPGFTPQEEELLAHIPSFVIYFASHIFKFRYIGIWEGFMPIRLFATPAFSFCDLFPSWFILFSHYLFSLPVLCRTIHILSSVHAQHFISEKATHIHTRYTQDPQCFHMDTLTCQVIFLKSKISKYSIDSHC